MVKIFRKPSDCPKGLNRKPIEIKVFVAHWSIRCKGATTGCLYVPAFAGKLYMEDCIYGNKKCYTGITKKSELVSK